MIGARRLTVLAAGLVVACLACGSSRRADDPVLTGATSVTTEVVPSSTEAPTTSSSVLASLAPTSAPTTEPATTTVETVPVTLPTPVAPPAENAVEPADEVGRIEIPKLGIDMAFFEGVTLTTLDRGPGHWPGSALPGQPGNVVIAGHRVSHTRPFRYIDKLTEGDQVIFTVGGKRFTYAVTGTEIVKPDRIDIVNQTPQPTATLFACHPPGSTQYRWVTRLALVTG
jgi:sortase A